MYEKVRGLLSNWHRREQSYLSNIRRHPEAAELWKTAASVARAFRNELRGALNEDEGALEQAQHPPLHPRGTGGHNRQGAIRVAEAAEQAVGQIRTAAEQGASV
jgi:hypothetical protein